MIPLHRKLALVGCALTFALWSAGAEAATRRVAVVVGSNAGGPTEKPLRYAEDDASKVAEVLTELGDVRTGDLFLVRAGGKSATLGALELAARRVALARQDPLDRTLLVFFFSGHSDGQALELGGDRLSFSELKAAIGAAKADVRLLIIDGCKSGAITQSKGGVRAEPFEIDLQDQLDATGEVLLTSSAADELALESREIRGSLFTHHLVSGLRGAADSSGDGRVTLAEAYRYTFEHTLSSAASSGARQHPGYDYRLAGKGELVLTEVAQPSAALELPEGIERALIVNVRRDQVLAELTSDNVRRLAVAPGEYAVRVWKGTQAYAARVTVAAAEVKKVSWADLVSVPSAPMASKGPERQDDALPDGVEGLSLEGRAEFGRGYLTVGERYQVFYGHHSAVAAGDFLFAQGKGHLPLSESDFYRRVGRADLATSYEARKTGAAVLGALSLGAMLGGVAYAFLGSEGCSLQPSDPNFGNVCVTQAAADGQSRGKVVGLTMVGGAVLLLGGSVVWANRHPVDLPGAAALADDYNTPWCAS